MSIYSSFVPQMLSFPLIWKIFSGLCIIIIIGLSPVTISGSRSSRKAYYGSPCNASVKCDIHSLLSCEEDTCQCLYPDAMIYSSDVGTCVSLVNEICGYLETKRVFINCVANAFCDQQQGVCKCTQGHVEGERQCMKQRGFGESCHSDNECMTELSLTCFKEVCQCDPKRYMPLTIKTDLTTFKATSKCVTLAGLPCTAKTGCVKKASCVSEAEGSATVSLSAFSWMQSGICRCDTGYEIDESGQCRGKFGSYCDVLANVSCAKEFQCLDGICSCKYPDDQIFLEEIGKCVSLVGGPCTGTSINQSSINEDAEINEEEIPCKRFMECRNSTCACKSGFVENKKRECDLSFGQFCTGETMSKCDVAAGLHCVDGRCACKDRRKEYNMRKGMCVGTAGSFCTMPSSLSHRNVINTAEMDDRKLPCRENMKCKPFRTQPESLSSAGFCTLTEGGGGETNTAHTMKPDILDAVRVHRQVGNYRDADY